ncbi:trigger factor [Saccharicrinis sp. FJH2]|uniref:trigger factor n=1 Tax=Saccharicrinis sp. FJH65 TaxID=3344659 RepID=UPI0035F2E659
MNITKQDINDVNAVITLNVEKSDYEENVNRVLKDYRKKANVPGFRPGKVPASLIQKMYGKAVLFDEVNKLMSDELNKYLSEADFQVLGDPLPSEDQETIDFDNQDTFEFKFDIGISPAVEISLTKREKLKYYDIKVDDELINKQVDYYRSRFGKQVDVEEAEEKDLLKGDLVQLDDAGNPLEGGIEGKSVVLSPERVVVEELKKEFLGKVKGKTIKFNPKTAFENDTEVSSLLNIKKEEVADLNSDFSFTVNEISHFEQAEINEELFKQIYPEDEVTTEEDMRKRIADEIKENLVSNSDYKFLLDAKDKLVEKVKDVELPEAFLKRWVVATNKELTDEQLEKEFPMFLDDLRWNMVKGSIAKANEIKLEEADVMTYAKKVAQSQFAQYGMTNVPDEHLENYAKEILKNEDQSRNISERAFENKILDKVKELVKLDVEEISLDAFNELVK